MTAAPRPRAPGAAPPPDLPELPELDQGEEGQEVDVGSFELSLGDDAEQPEDASALDTFEVDIQVLTDSGSNEAASDLDIGTSGLIDHLPEERDEPELEHEPSTGADLDDHLGMPLESDDPSTDSELGDDGLEALPELVNEEGDGEAGPDVERAFLPSAPEGQIPDARRYESEWLLLGSACSALARSEDDVLGAAEHLMRFGRERLSLALPAGTRTSSLAVLDGVALLATNRGLLELTTSGELSVSETPELAKTSGAELVELAAAPGPSSLWARLANGALLRRRAGAWERHEAGGDVRSLTSGEQRITLLVVSHRPTLQLSSDGGSSYRELLLPEPARTVALGGAAEAVSEGDTIALWDGQRGLCVSSDGGETFNMVTGAVNVTAVTIGQHSGAVSVFAALHREGKDQTDLLAVDPSNAKAVRIAELSGQPDEDAEETGRTLALLFADGSLWAAGGYGLARLRAPRG